MHTMKKKKKHTVGTIQELNMKAVAKDKIGAPSTHIRHLTFLASYGHFNEKWRSYECYMCPNLPSL